MGNRKKVALVTGANKGIGLEIVEQLAKTGARCYLAGRDEERVKSAVAALCAKGLDVRPLLLDITSNESILAAAEHLDAEEQQLDILVNNAAIRIEEYGKSPSEQPMSDWLRTFETNLFGTVSTTRGLLVLLLRSPSARIVNVSSLLGSIGTHCDQGSYAYSDMFKSLPAYSASKSALNSWTVHLAYELRNTPIKVNSAHPGYTRTDMNDGAGDQAASEGAKTSVMLATLPDDGPSGSFFHLDEVILW